MILYLFNMCCLVMLSISNEACTCLFSAFLPNYVGTSHTIFTRLYNSLDVSFWAMSINICSIHLTTIEHKRCFSNPTVLVSVVPRLTDWLLNHCQTLAHRVSPQNNPHGAIGPQAHTFWLGDSHSLFYQSWLDPVQIKIAKYMWM